MLQHILVGIIVGIATFLVLRHGFRVLSGRAKPSCPFCPQADGCANKFRDLEKRLDKIAEPHGRDDDKT